MISDNVFIETPRLYIKNLERSDFAEFRQQQQDADIMTFFGGPRNDEDIERITNLLYNHFNTYGFSAGLIFLKETNIIIGRGGLSYLDFKGPPDVELFYFLYKPYWNKGYATELGNALIDYAFEKLDCNKVYTTIDPDNVASETVSKKLGMTLEKTDTYNTLNKTVMYYVKHRDEH